ncbi:hypothetical protein [Streptomyces poonensis]|uniref:Secreted protein n=1 Tax=Streptomyces poonensis TaxID=68255 RepID=A0A918UI52_9ACTN|nr:hypothetical protein [Streptomyces poonensis]GGZ11247.1 hypothetical protein GCM10010365_33440 [Streptomyces poonensis]GLJ91598.1 hypothetical protein GCM10017589_42050 [Streptomyces poonensis]
MSTGVIIALIVIVAAVVVIAAVLSLRDRGAHGGRGLRRRFGPEYDRALARHDGDTKAAEAELAERVERHGSLQPRPLEPAERERYEVRWTAVQERFVDSPREALAEADRLLGEVAGARGFPDGGRYDEQLDALSVHHAHHVHGYRRVHRVANSPANGDGSRAGTEEMRTALVEARALFEELVAPGHRNSTTHRTATEGHGARHSSRHSSRNGMPWSFNRRHPKES